jgi:hypothetical protein
MYPLYACRSQHAVVMVQLLEPVGLCMWLSSRATNWRQNTFVKAHGMLLLLGYQPTGMCV